MGSYRNTFVRHSGAVDGAKATKEWYHGSRGSGARRSRGHRGDGRHGDKSRYDGYLRKADEGRGHGERGGWVAPLREGDRRQERRSRSRSRRGGRQTNCKDGKDQWRDQRGRGGRVASAERSTATSEYSSSSESRASSAGRKKGAKKSADSDKDEIVHFAWQKGMVLGARYRMIRLLGDGTFGRVLLAHDQYDDRQVAIKVIRDVKRYAENARIEADILKDIRRIDPMGKASRSAIMFETFAHDRHFCLVFEPCGASLYDFLKRNSFRGFWMQDIQSFARQSLSALGFLHQTLQMTHTDLKPENILLESLDAPRPSEFPREASWKPSSKNRTPSSTYLRPASPCIRLIDFGNATYEDEHHSSIINTRQYRGPEVILSLGWNERSDVWSMGCIFMELYTGELLFGTHENLEHLALMERVLEPLPASMLNGTPRGVKEKYVAAPNRGGQPRLPWPERAQSSSSERHVRSQRPLKNLCGDQQHALFASFVGSLLTLDPARRPSAQEALNHAFFSKQFND